MSGQDEYSALMDQIVNGLRMLATLGPDTDTAKKLMRTIQNAEAVGPIFHPTEFRNAMTDDRLARQKRIVALYLHAQHELSELFDDVDR